MGCYETNHIFNNIYCHTTATQLPLSNRSESNGYVQALKSHLESDIYNIYAEDIMREILQNNEGGVKIGDV